MHSFTLDPLYPWGINYFPVNFQSTTGTGRVIKQLYFRQALAYLVNQQSIITGPLRGYGLYTVGPVGSYPSTQSCRPRASRATRSRTTRPRPRTC